MTNEQKINLVWKRKKVTEQKTKLATEKKTKIATEQKTKMATELFHELFQSIE